MSLKKKEPILILVSITVFWFLLVSTIPAYAYLDPGSGSMLLQVLLGGVAALAVILKFYWNRFLSLSNTSSLACTIECGPQEDKRVAHT